MLSSPFMQIKCQEITVTVRNIYPQMMQRTDSFEKTWMLGKIEGGRRRG